MTWTTKDGQTIVIADMEDSHLLNTVRFLERMHGLHHCQEESDLLMAGPPHGEMADYEYDHMLNSLQGKYSNRAPLLLAQYEQMLLVLEERGLEKLKWE